MPTRHDERSDGHRPPRSDALRQRAGARREQQHAGGDRQQRRAGLQRGVAEVGLQVDDEQERDGAERGVHRERHRVGARELLRLEHAERHHRVRDARLDEEERDEREHTDRRRADRGHGPPVAGSLDERVARPRRDPP